MDMERIEHARWVLERNLHWIASVETKTAVILSVDVAMLGALAVAFSALEPVERTAWCTVLSVLAALPNAISITFGALAVWPQTDGPPTSFIFFGKIRNWSAVEFERNFLASDYSALLGDCLAQIHRNAQIAHIKYGRVTSSMKWAFVSISPWLIALVTLVNANQ